MMGTLMPDSLADAIARLIPESLDQILRVNRDRARLYESTPEELAALQRPVERGFPKGVISNWCFITFLIVETNEPMVNLVGYNAEERSSWMTSLVVGIDGDAVETKSGSLYLLDGPRSTEFDLPFICATLNSWGLGQMFGVQKFFF